MKKKIALALSVLMAISATAVTAYAAEDNRGAVITTTVDPAYTVTIPLDIRVPFNREMTDFGTVKLDTAQLEPNKCVTVTVLSDGSLENRTDSGKVIPYSIYEGKSDNTGNVFSSAVFEFAGEKSDLSIGITRDDWNKAYAGDYEDTVTFRIEYKEK